MNQESRKIKSFTELNAWKEGHKLVLEIYKITKTFPKGEPLCHLLPILPKVLAEILIKKNYNFIRWL